MINKKIATFSTLLIVICLVVLMTTFKLPTKEAYADTTNWSYTISKGVATITKYNGTLSNNDTVTIPSSIGDSNAPVTKIGDGSTSVFNQGVDFNVKIPSSVTTINNNAFINSNLKSVTYTDSSGSGSNITTIGQNAFQNTKLSNFKIPQGITSVGIQAFCDCSSLTTVSFPKKNYTVSSDRVNYERALFDNCNNLTTFTTYGTQTNPAYSVVNNSLLLKTGDSSYNLLRFATGATGATGEWTIPTQVTSINSFAFRAAQITKLIIPTNTKLASTSFGRGCIVNSKINTFESNSSSFTVTNDVLYYTDPVTHEKTLVLYPFDKAEVTDNPTNQTEFTISSDVSVVGQYSFYGCAIYKFTFEEGVKTIKNRSMASTYISSITLPASLENIEGGAFSECANLTSITVANANPNLKAIDNVVYSRDEAILYVSSPNITSITLPENLETIKSFAFHTCRLLENVVIPANVKKIESYAFHTCSALANITFLHETSTNNLNISDNAFKGVESNLQVKLKNRLLYNYFLTNFDINKFDNFPNCLICENPVVTITLYDSDSASTTYLYSYGDISTPNKQLKLYSDSTHESEITSMELTEKEGYINYGFYTETNGMGTQYIDRKGNFINNLANTDYDQQLYLYWVERKTYTFEDSIEIIEGNAITNPAGVVKVVIPETITQIQANAFGNCVDLEEITFNHHSLQNLTISNNSLPQEKIVNLLNRQVANKLKSKITCTNLTLRYNPYVTITLNDDSTTTTLYSWGDVSSATPQFKIYSDGNPALNTAPSNEITSLSPIEKENYFYYGFFTEPNGGGTQYVNRDGNFTNDLANIDHDQELYLYWVIKSTYTFEDETITKDNINTPSAGITEITFTSDVKTISNDLLDSCENLQKVTFLHINLDDVTIGRNIFGTNQLNVFVENRKVANQLKQKIFSDNLNFSIKNPLVEISLKDGDNTIIIYSTYINNELKLYSDSALTKQITSLEITEKDDLVFKGYYSNVSGNGVNYINEDGVFLDNFDQLDEDSTLFAYWVKPAQFDFKILLFIGGGIVLLIIVAIIVKKSSKNHRIKYK